ncbi:MAG: hypothetical protein JST82_03795 [Bacteroidetes bacterium]|nr:hypothetical protein [Bacteroidota bacterium]
MKDWLIRLTYIISIVCYFVGALFKIQHWVGGHDLLLIGYISYVIFTIFALIEIYQSTKPTWEKILWTLTFILLLATGILILLIANAVFYIQYRRKRLLERK